jgi:3-hydroxybutyryl-CoA dehydrogenase
MEIVVRCSEEQRKELAIKAQVPALQVHYVQEVNAFHQFPRAGAFLDLLFENDAPGIEVLRQLQTTVIIHSVVHTLNETSGSFVRINAWPTLLSRPVVEGSCRNAGSRKTAEEVFLLLGKTVEWLPDEPGFVCARVISAIINEAYFALAEGVSTKEEIDTAMKLGTNYPFGPFEWAGKIGLENIARLLQKLSIRDEKYLPAALMLEEIGNEE